jgi:hypothetical protein
MNLHLADRRAARLTYRRPGEVRRQREGVRTFFGHASIAVVEELDEHRRPSVAATRTHKKLHPVGEPQQVG